MRNGFRLWSGRGGIGAMALGLAITAGPRIGVAEETAGSENRIRVHVVDLRNDHGNLRCSLYASAEDFPNNDDMLATTVTAPITDEAGTCEFTAVKPGTYAVVVFHDENADGKFNRNWLGMPKEGFGFSNDAPARWRPPKFDAASFPFNGDLVEILVHIRYRM